jgi:hypothetical protein
MDRQAANQRIDQYCETPQEALTRAQEWVAIREGAYRALGAPYGGDDDDLLCWLDERNPLLKQVTNADPC